MRVVLLSFFIAGKAMAANVNFIPNDLKFARNQARTEGKTVLVKFYAKWCLPCQIMDSTAWVNESVVEQVSKNCVAVQIDYDNFDGIAYRQHYQVERLPTVLMLDACGQEVARLENAFTSKHLLNWLQLFDDQKYKVCEDGHFEPHLDLEEPFVADSSINNLDEVPPTEKPQDNGGNPKKHTENAVAPGQTPDKRNWINRVLKKKKKKENIEPEPPAVPSEPTAVTPPVSHNNFDKPSDFRPTQVHEDKEYPNLYDNPIAAKPVAANHESASKFVSWESEREGFAIQVVASGSLEKAQLVKNQCLATFDKPVAILPPTNSGDGLYRVVVGQFSEKAEADRFKLTVRKAFADAFVKDLGKF